MTEPLTLAQRLLAGLKGVTPGPWKHYYAQLRSGMSTINEVQTDSHRQPVVQWAGFDNSARPKAQHKRNAAHIARCAPENIRALAEAVISQDATIASLRDANKALTADARGMVPADLFTAMKSDRDRLSAELAVKAHPLDEWHEDHGDVVWWCWRDGAWLGEPAYIGSPLDLGQTVECHTHAMNGETPAARFLVGGWPGYHTHWTPHPTFPPAPEAPQPEAKEAREDE